MNCMSNLKEELNIDNRIIIMNKFKIYYGIGDVFVSDMKLTKKRRLVLSSKIDNVIGLLFCDLFSMLINIKLRNENNKPIHLNTLDELFKLEDSSLLRISLINKIRKNINLNDQRPDTLYDNIHIIVNKQIKTYLLYINDYNATEIKIEIGNNLLEEIKNIIYHFIKQMHDDLLYSNIKYKGINKDDILKSINRIMKFERGSEILKIIIQYIE